MKEQNRKRKEKISRLLAMYLIFLMVCQMCQVAHVQAAEGTFQIKNGVLVAYQGAGSKVTIPKGVTKIGERAFYGCDSLTK